LADWACRLWPSKTLTDPALPCHRQTGALLKHAQRIQDHYVNDVIDLTVACRYVERLPTPDLAGGVADRGTAAGVTRV
jgi:hypothetical protein